ncbi:MAG: hypothetical protein EOO38_01975, partial [Cytophagaceae bacterium]
MQSHIKTSDEIRAAVAEIESNLASAKSTLLARQAEHHSAIRAAVHSTAPSDAVAAAEASVAAAQSTHARIETSLAVAREMLAESLEAEHQAEREAAKAEIEAGLEKMMALAGEADLAFATFVGLIKRLYALETDLHRAARQA